MRVQIPDIRPLPRGQFYGITVGLPGSGKSTAVREAIVDDIIRQGKFGNNRMVVEVNRDDIRKAIGAKNGKREKEVWKLRNAAIEAALAAGHSVVSSDTNLKQSVRQGHEDRANQHCVPFYTWSFLSVPVHQCIEQDLKREDSVGKDVIERMYYEYWAEQPKPPNEGIYRCIIVDIDGTLAHTNIPYPAAYERDYTQDVVDEAIRDLVNEYNPNGTVILLSGRSEVHREATEQWLAAMDIRYEHLFMRRPGTEHELDDMDMKKELYMEHVQGKFFVDYVLDDRPRVCRMWRAELGLKCLQVGPNVEF